MRVTNKMMVEAVQAQLRRRTERLSEAQNRLSSGKRLSKPSDDPAAVARALAVRRGLAVNEQYRQNVDAALSWIGATDSTLGSAEQLMLRAHNLAVRGSNDSLSPAELASIGQEVGQLVHDLVSMGNAKYGNEYLFAGFKQTQAPFVEVGSPPTGITYRGDTGQLNRSVGDDTVMAVNVDGEAVLGPSLDALLALRDALESGDRAAVATCLPALDLAHECLTASRADLGARANRLQAVATQLDKFSVELKARLSRDEDLDLQEAALTYAIDEATYRATLAVSAKTLAPSLIDYLR